MTQRTTPRMRVGRVQSVVVIALCGAAVSGAIYESVGVRGDGRRLPQVGRSVDIGGRSLNIFCSGEGWPAVVFDAGAGEPGFSWSHIQPEIARVTRACWFDRAGLGWSDAGPFPRTSAAMARDLRALLEKTEVLRPFVYVGHSLGGLNARVYHGLYPHDLAGVVLVDAAHEDEPRRAPRFMRGRSAPRFLWRPIWMAAQTARVFGVIRFLTPRTDVVGAAGPRTREQMVEALRRQPKALAALMDASTPDSYAQAESSGGFGDRPLIVLTRGRLPKPPYTTELERESAAYERVWMQEIQPKLARLSTRGRHILVPASGHRLPDEAPQQIVHAVREIVREIHSQSIDRIAPGVPAGIPEHDPRR